MEFPSIHGMENEIIFVLPDGSRIDLLQTQNTPLADLLAKANVTIKGNHNTIEFRFKKEGDAEALLKNPGFSMLIVGDDNSIEAGEFSVVYYPAWGMMGLQLIIGGFPDDMSEPGVDRRADHCSITIGDHVTFVGCMIYLQDDDSSVRIGDRCMVSWGVDIWCTDVHTVTDLEGNPKNFGKAIDIAEHVWVGKDVKIGKNVAIARDSIVGWGSIVTRPCSEPNVVLAGVPARVVKRGVNW